MVVISAGSFRMGDMQGGGSAQEKPVHGVRVERPFALGAARSRSRITIVSHARAGEAL
jgi:formylglycine-generating enzyme required for sulfatase activity